MKSSYNVTELTDFSSVSYDKYQDLGSIPAYFSRCANNKTIIFAKNKALKLWNSISEFKPNAKTVVTLGTFDGVHLGHRKILAKLQKDSGKNFRESVVLTFFPHPRTILDAENEVLMLNTMEEKTSLLDNYGIDNLIIHPFDRTFSQLSATEFVENILVKKLNVGKIVIGHDHRFGKGRSANIDDLVIFGKKFGFEVEQISPHDIDEVTISSTKIRKALANGDIELANQYLGYPYMLTGVVIKGRMMGRMLGYPTANILLDETYKLIPKDGVYAVTVDYNRKLLKGMMNIGNNPTVGGVTKSIEVNIFDFDEDLYGKKIQVNIYHRIRDEHKFDSLDALKQQLHEDKTETLKLLSN